MHVHTLAPTAAAYTPNIHMKTRAQKPHALSLTDRHTQLHTNMQNTQKHFWEMPVGSVFSVPVFSQSRNLRGKII